MLVKWNLYIKMYPYVLNYDRRCYVTYIKPYLIVRDLDQMIWEWYRKRHQRSMKFSHGNIQRGICKVCVTWLSGYVDIISQLEQAFCRYLLMVRRSCNLPISYLPHLHSMHRVNIEYTTVDQIYYSAFGVCRMFHASYTARLYLIIEQLTVYQYFAKSRRRFWMMWFDQPVYSDSLIGLTLKNADFIL